LGAEPSDGVATTPDQNGRSKGPPPQLRDWDTHTGRWELAETRVPCQDLQTCILYATGAAVVVGGDGAAPRTTYWLTMGVGAGESQLPVQTYSRRFIPAD